MKTPEEAISSRLLPGLLLAWFCLALAFGLAGHFRQASAPVVAVTVWSLTGLILLASWKLPFIRREVVRLNIRSLVSINLVRFVGFYFLILGGDVRLPRAFAFPAGVGDIAVAFGALVLVSSTLVESRWFLLVWNVLGLADIIAVVFNALRCGLRDWQSMAAFRELPLSLLPTFFVPLVLASHVLIFIRQRQNEL